MKLRKGSTDRESGVRTDARFWATIYRRCPASPVSLLERTELRARINLLRKTSLYHGLASPANLLLSTKSRAFIL
ncbi:hypothetical protein RR46_15069 [Papilio xuthus]|uniref:Uncharacterized protein n=1 Tax=Papilio xuthus TaxID=66420 RepID=A0A194PKE6_PAPXU|nr:hypothetical protein RR46_15069 [Papilio xuthus]